MTLNMATQNLLPRNILEGIKEDGETESAIGYVKEVDAGIMSDYDVIILGAPNHMGRPSRAMKKFVEAVSEHNLKAKQVAVFGTYSGNARPVDRAVKKLAKITKRNFLT